MSTDWGWKPVYLGYFCRWCSAEQLRKPEPPRDGYLCGNCGATNWPPLRSEPFVPSERFL